MENNKISKIEFSDSDKNKLNEFISYEREAAIYDLISENYFEIIDEKSNGPFIMNISVEEGILLIKLYLIGIKRSYLLSFLKSFSW